VPIHIGAKVPIEQEFEILEAIRTYLLRAKARLGILYGEVGTNWHPQVFYAVGGIDQAVFGVDELLAPVKRELQRKADRALGEIGELVRGFFWGLLGGDDITVEDAGDYIRIRPKRGGE